MENKKSLSIDLHEKINKLDLETLDITIQIRKLELQKIKLEQSQNRKNLQKEKLLEKLSKVKSTKEDIQALKKICSVFFKQEKSRYAKLKELQDKLEK
ncbi:hypothetical protein [[Mycoplasma] testudinis]|uniref:hypothetical protein n=1 Tax=[Mycoplasma] testudinis TaxID=33924 RepID=UPI000484E16D|nr:hypothetical protein [[Mycoplasma] testudinis]